MLDKFHIEKPVARNMLVIFLGFFGVLIVLISTRWGAALGDDSYAYIRPVHDALAGEGLKFNPLFPPFLTIVLAGFGYLGVEPVEAIRFLNAFMFGFAIVLSFLVTYQLTYSYGFSLAAAVSILFTANLIEIFSSAMSEPLYLTLLLTSMFAAIRYWKTMEFRWLLFAAIASGLAAYTRYAGVTIIASIAFFLLIALRRPIVQRLRTVVLFVGIASIPIATYALQNFLKIGRPVGQSEFSWSLIRNYPYRLFLRNIYDWIIPARLIAGYEDEITIVLVLSVFVVGVSFALLYRSKFYDLLRDVFTSPPFQLILIVLTFNLVLLVISRGLFAGGDTFNPRYTSPIQLLTYLFFISILSKFFLLPAKLPKIFASVIAIGFIALLSARAVYIVQFLYRQGSGYSGKRWHISETIAYLNRRPDTELMSTAAPGVYFWTGRLPLNVSDSRAEVEDFLCDTGGFLVVIDSLPLSFYGIDEQEITDGLIVEQDFSEGTIYRVDPAECDDFGVD